MLFFKSIFGATKLNGKGFECNFTFLLSLKDGTVEPQVPHPAVPIKDVVLLKSLMDDGLSFTSALRLLRRSHFPFNYDPHPWKPGML